LINFRLPVVWRGIDFRRCFLPAVILLLACASSALARNATITLEDNSQFRGEVESDDANGVRLKISGISQLFARDKIRDVKYELTAAEEYQQRRAELADDDLDGRYRLASYLALDRKELDLARKELTDLAKRFPQDERVSLLAAAVDNRLKLMKEPPAKPANPVIKPTLAPQLLPDKPASEGIEKEKSEEDKPAVLTEQDINQIKVYEIDFSTKPPPRVIIPRETVDEFIKVYAEDDKDLRGRANQAAFRRAPGIDQLRKFFDLRAREFYRQVEVKNDPPVMLAFKTSVHRNYVLNYCGTSGCHGGDKAGQFKLIPYNAVRDETVYTNFFMLDAWQRGKGYMIDRDKPEYSYLVQFGLPRVDAKYPHPEVEGWNFKIRNTEDPVYGMVVNWIKMLYNDPRPKYGITLKGINVGPDAPAAAEDAKPVEDAKPAPM